MIKQLFNEALSGQRTPRSQEYRSGVMAALRHRFEGVPIMCGFKPGEAQYDAWRAGVNEGNMIAKQGRNNR